MLTVGSYSKIDNRTLIAPENELLNHTSEQKRKTTANNKFIRLSKPRTTIQHSKCTLIYCREIKMCGHTETCSQIFMIDLFEFH